MAWAFLTEPELPDTVNPAFDARLTDRIGMDEERQYGTIS